MKKANYGALNAILVIAMVSIIFGLGQIYKPLPFLFLGSFCMWIWWKNLPSRD